MNRHSDIVKPDLEKIESEFVRAWQKYGKRPDISALIKGLSANSKKEALEFLIPIDLQYRFQAGEDCSRDDYQSLGESAVAIAAELFADATPESPIHRKETVRNRSTKNQGRGNNSEPHDAEPKNLITDRYRLINKIGQGGMGSVWLAQQEKPMRRRVAIKIIGRSMNGKESLARFAAERQALAMMDHPNIAKVLDAGTTEDDRPFFAMELVKGVPITQYCDDNRLPLEKRLELMVTVCDAVQHAHQKGIIHRDLKPSNILVSVKDGAPVAKVIDFGLAKALEHFARLTEESVVTEYGRVVGTLQYMSPEQAGSNELDIDTRTDVYALGVILYQLLTDAIPLERNTLSGKSLIQIVDIIRTLDIKRPSVRLAEDESHLAVASNLRQSEPLQLVRALEGELDWIVLKALARDRTERYQSANEFGADVRRYLNDEPILAKPPTKYYLFKKFAKKNRGLTAVIASVATLMLLASVVSTYFWLSAVNSEQIAVNKTIEAEQKSEQMEQLKIQFERRLDVFLDALRSTNPLEGAKPKTAPELLASVVANLKKEGTIDSKFKAAVMHEIGITLRGSGQYSLAVDALENAYEIRGQELGMEDLDTNDSLSELVKARMGFAKSGGPGSDQKNITYIEESLDMMNIAFDNRAKILDETDTKFLLAESDLGAAYVFAFKELRKIGVSRKTLIDRSVDILSSTLKRQQKILGSNHEYTLSTLNNLANAHLKRKDVDRAIELLDEAKAGWQKLLMAATDSKEMQRITNKLSQSENNFGEALQEAGRFEKAIEFYEKALQTKEVGYGAGHPIWCNTFRSLLDCLIEIGELSKAKRLYVDSVHSIEQLEDTDSAETIASLDVIRKAILVKHGVAENWNED